MLRIIQLIALFSALVFLVAIIGWFLIYLSQPPHELGKQQAPTETPYSEKQAKERETLGQRIISDPIALFTLLLVIVNFFLAAGGLIALYYFARTADAAKKSADIAEKTLVNIQRPWIKIVDVKLNGPIIFTTDQTTRQINMNMSSRLQNIGTTPAADVKFNFKMFLLDSGQEINSIFRDMKNICEKLKKESLSYDWFMAIGRVGGYLFPGEPSRELFARMFIPFETFEKEIGQKIETFKSILIIAYATYKFPFDETVHIISATYLLSRKDGIPIFPPTKDDEFSANGKVHSIVTDKLDMVTIWYGHAD